MRIINVPIEPIEMRYTKQWNTWFKTAFEDEFADIITLDDIPSSGKIKSGSFLDTIETNRYKAKQLIEIIALLEMYDDSDPFVLFFHDIWFPGLASIAYIRDGMEFKNLKICGCLHSGGYDAADFIRNHDMNRWSDYLEQGWFGGIVDEIYVATNFHKEVVDNYFDLPTDAIKMTGFPLYVPDVSSKRESTINTIVFPHRLVLEKHPEVFDNLKEKYPRWNWIKTMEFDFDKDEYYKVLANSQIAISAADHENWGISMQEATLCGAIPLVPDRLSYQELYLDVFKYKTYDELVSLIDKYTKDPPMVDLIIQQNMITEKGREAIPNIIEHIYNLI